MLLVVSALTSQYIFDNLKSIFLSLIILYLFTVKENIITNHFNLSLLLSCTLLDCSQLFLLIFMINGCTKLPNNSILMTVQS